MLRSHVLHTDSLWVNSERLKIKTTKQINQLKKPTDSNKLIKQNQKCIPVRISCFKCLETLVSKGSIKPAARPVWWYLCPSCGKDPINLRCPKVSVTANFFSKLLFKYFMWFFKFLAASIFFLFLFLLILNSGKRNIFFLTVRLTGKSSFFCCLSCPSTFKKTVVLR